jgi:hypothetical protein
MGNEREYLKEPCMVVRKLQTRICMTETYEHLKSRDGHHVNNHNLDI